MKSCYTIRVEKSPKRSYGIDRNIRWLTRKRDALLKRLTKTGPVVNGSLVEIHRTCGNSENCRCTRGFKHASWYLSYALKGKTKMVYIPVDLEEDVRQWSKAHRELKECIHQICDLQKEIIRAHVGEKRRRKDR